MLNQNGETIMKKMNDVAAKTFEAAMKPVLEFNNFFVKTSEKTFTKHVECYKAYTNLGMENFNQAFKVRTFEDMVEYTEKQKGVAQKTTDMLVSDVKAFTDLNTKFVEEARSLIETNVKTSVTAVSEAVKSAA